jgi:hypothetical protein
MEYLNFLRRESVEERIAGLVQCQRFLQEMIDKNSDFNYEEYLDLVIEAITPSFLVQTLSTKFDGPNFSLQTVAVAMFEIIRDKNPSILKQFSCYTSELLELVFLEVSRHPSLSLSSFNLLSSEQFQRKIV